MLLRYRSSENSSKNSSENKNSSEGFSEEFFVYLTCCPAML